MGVSNLPEIVFFLHFLETTVYNRSFTRVCRRWNFLPKSVKAIETRPRLTVVLRVFPPPDVRGVAGWLR